VPTDSPVDITTLLQIIITAIIAPFIPIVATQLKRWLDANISAKQQAAIFEAARVAVLATEQAGLGGVDAKEHAVRLADAQLAAMNITVDWERLEAVIEAQVMDQFNFDRARHLPEPAPDA
jgi:hypothetical protein